MKVEVENQPPGMATLRIELPPEDVRKEWDAIANNYSRYARIPGYRAGKAPRQVIEKKFRKEIQDELTKALVSKSYHEAIAEKQLRVVSLADVGDVEFGQDRSMRFRATVVTAPEFELPEYKNIPVQLQLQTLTETVEVRADAASAIFTPSHAGAATNIAPEAIQELPTINRSIADFARTSPYVNPTSQGSDANISIAGRNNRVVS